MPLLLAVTLAAATTVQPTCSWDNPGHNRYTGGAAAAIDRYTDIPEAVRSTLKRRMAEGQPDDKVAITRDQITGKYQYDPTIRDMHFGRASVCTSVTRSKWSETRSEPGAVYCVDQHCILVPRICGNVSRISRAPAVAAKPKEDEREMDKPMEFADLGLADAPEREDMPLDPAEESERQAAHKRALGALAGMQAAEDAAQAAGDDGYGRYVRNGDGIGEDDTPRISPVPEADTGAMLLAGLGLIGWQARRRAKAARQAAE